MNRNDMSVKTIKLSNEILETLKILEDYTSCKNKKIDEIDIDEIENCLAELEEEEQGEKKESIINELNHELFKINIRLNKKILCESCKRKKIEKLSDECGNEEIATFLYYDHKLNTKYYNDNY